MPCFSSLLLWLPSMTGAQEVSFAAAITACGRSTRWHVASGTWSMVQQPFHSDEGRGSIGQYQVCECVMSHESWPESVSGWSYSRKFTQLLARLWLAFLPLPLDCCYPDFMLKWYDVPLGSCLSHVRRSMWALWCDVVPGVIRKCIRVFLLRFPCMVNDR